MLLRTQAQALFQARPVSKHTSLFHERQRETHSHLHPIEAQEKARTGGGGGACLSQLKLALQASGLLLETALPEDVAAVCLFSCCCMMF